jgi:hypothetical protein
MQGEAQLMQIVDALSLLRPSFGLDHYRQQKRSENSDDGDDNQKFNQRKC